MCVFTVELRWLCYSVVVIVQIHNDDGVWVRLSVESVREFCNPLNGYTEGWAMQYNQHLGKTLLAPVEDIHPASDDHPKDSQPPHDAPPPGRHKFKTSKNKNGMFYVNVATHLSNSTFSFLFSSLSKLNAAKIM